MCPIVTGALQTWTSLSMDKGCQDYHSSELLRMWSDHLVLSSFNVQKEQRKVAFLASTAWLKIRTPWCTSRCSTSVGGVVYGSSSVPRVARTVKRDLAPANSQLFGSQYSIQGLSCKSCRACFGRCWWDSKVFSHKQLHLIFLGSALSHTIQAKDPFWEVWAWV